MVRKRISFIVPCYNEQKWLPCLLDSVNKCETSFNQLEFIIVDNASTDLTVDKLWEIIPNLRFSVQLVHELRKGVSHARNAGANASQGEILVFIDADNRLTQEFIDDLWRTIDRPGFTGATIRTLAEPGSLRGSMLFYILEVIKIYSYKRFGKSVATRQGYEATGGFDTSVKLGENVIFTNQLKNYADQTNGKIYHIRTPIYCSLRRFRKLGYRRILGPWLLAYLGQRYLPYKTMDEL